MTRRPGFHESWLTRDDAPPLVGPITVRVDDVTDAERFPEIAAAIQHARSLRSPDGELRKGD